MRIKVLYLIFILILHAVLTILIYYLLKENKWYFILSEILIIASLWISYKIYQAFIKPIDLMKTGVNAIKDEDYNVRFLQTKSSDINDLILVFNAMLERLTTERVRTQEQAYFLENLIDASPIGMVILGYDGEITSINPAARLQFQLDRIELRPSPDIREHPLLKEILALDVNTSKIISPEGIKKFRCQATNVIHKGFRRKFVLIEELSKELLQNEKEAYGKVIRMMAHEVNNSMGAVNSILQTVIEFGFQSQEEVNEYVDFLQLAKTRNDELAKFMKNFADVIRLPDARLKPTDIIELLEDSIQIMRSVAKEAQVTIDLDSDEDQLHFDIDGNLMHQVFVNIIKNGIESIGDQGRIICKVSRTAPHIVISDNGKGISDEEQGKLFSPFYSSKPNGQGIGLIVIRDILISHGAQFSLSTNKETGWTEFKITF